MNRRSFFKTLAVAAAGFSVLPSATTYARAKWVKQASSGIYVVNPAWVNAPYEVAWFVCGDPKTITKENMCGYIFPKDDYFTRYPIGPEGSFRVQELRPVRFDSLDMKNPIPSIIRL